MESLVFFNLVRKGGKKMELLKRLVTEEEGQDIVVVVIWVAVRATGVDTSVSTIWSKVGSSLNSAGGS